MDAQMELESLKVMCEGATLWTEGGQPIAYLPSFRFPTREGERVMDLLLVPFTHTGYETRLFFRDMATKMPPPWTQVPVCGQSWWGLSWRGVQANLPWPQMLAAHLRAVL